MRTSAIWMVIGLAGALSTTACASMQKLEKEAQADLKEAGSLKKEIEAVKKGDLNAAGDVAAVTAVKGALAKNEKTRSAGIEVEAKGGVVTLKGKTDAATSAEAEKVAKGIPGVSKVVVELDGKAHASKDDKDAKDSKDAKDTRATNAKDAKDAPAKDAKDTRATSGSK